ncbi:MAG TPA: hypothetical protein VJG64_00335 [Candidatus Paceibacterota bacterium]
MNFLLSIPYIVWLIISAVLFAGVEYFSKKFALSPSWTYIALLFAVDILAVLAWLPAILQKNQLSIVGAMWAVLSLAATVLIGTVIFKEALSTVGIIGLVFALISVVLLSIA